MLPYSGTAAYSHNIVYNVLPYDSAATDGTAEGGHNIVYNVLPCDSAATSLGLCAWTFQGDCMTFRYCIYNVFFFCRPAGHDSAATRGSADIPGRPAGHPARRGWSGVWHSAGQPPHTGLLLRRPGPGHPSLGGRCRSAQDDGSLKMQIAWQYVHITLYRYIKIRLSTRTWPPALLRS